VSFCNFARANPGSYVRQVADIILEDQLEPTADDEPPSIDTGRWAETFEAIAGFYRDPRQDRPLHLWIREGKARGTQGFGRDENGLLLVPQGNGRYHLWPGDDTVTVAMTNGRPAYAEVPGLRFGYIGPAMTNVDASPYLGTYWSEELGTEYRIEADTGQATLALVHRKRDTHRFRAAFEDGFWSPGHWLTFQRDSSGRVVGFSWSTGRVRKVKFERR
jgi:hypothetical protein